MTRKDINARQLEVIDRVRDYIELHYRDGISLRDVASALGYSCSDLTNLVRTVTGKPLNAWIIDRRIAAAQQLLADPYSTVAEVAAVGLRNENPSGGDRGNVLSSEDRETDMNTPTTVQRKEDIEFMLAHGLAPITENVAALVELGFTRSYPAARGGYEATVWERSIDHGYRRTRDGLRRVMVRQRAFVPS